MPTTDELIDNVIEGGQGPLADEWYAILEKAADEGKAAFRAALKAAQAAKAAAQWRESISGILLDGSAKEWLECEGPWTERLHVTHEWTGEEDTWEADPEPPPGLENEDRWISTARSEGWDCVVYRSVGVDDDGNLWERVERSGYGMRNDGVGYALVGSDDSDDYYYGERPRYSGRDRVEPPPDAVKAAKKAAKRARKAAKRAAI